MSEATELVFKPATATSVVIEPRKAEFARRLIAAMHAKGLGSAELVRKVRQHLPPGSHFQAANLSQYRSAYAIPKRTYLAALCKALDMTEEELISSSLVSGERKKRLPLPAGAGGSEGAEHLPAFLVQDKGDGTVWLQLNQCLPWATALRIIEVLGREIGLAERRAPERSENGAALTNPS
jgi:hypothetical protein